MKLKENMVLTELGDMYIAVPVGGNNDFKGVVRLNETGAEIWKGISEGLDEESIAERIVEKYDGVDIPHAKEAIQQVVNHLLSEGIMEE